MRQALYGLVLMLACLCEPRISFAWIDTIFTDLSPPNTADYSLGTLGILLPTYRTYPLLVAYRHLSGLGFEVSQDSTTSFPTDLQQSAVRRWLEARVKISEPVTNHDMRIERELPGEEALWHGFYLNCLDDAFDTATQTLNDRIHRFGADSPVVTDWARAQDKVFENCSGGLSIPDPAPADSPPLLQSDRAYQIAAAYFHADRFDEARERFAQIANDPASPWRSIAAYLVARSLVRKATLIPGFGFDRAVMVEAEAQLNKVLNDATLSALHPAAQRLMAFVYLRLHPQERLQELAHSLLQTPVLGTPDDETISEYRMLLFRDQIKPVDDLSDWILTFRDANGLAHAVDKWEATAALPWLVVALSKVSAAHPKAAVLLQAAKKVESHSVAFATVTFHLLRLIVEAGQQAEARQQLDTLPSDGGRAFPPSSRNLFFALRMKLARDVGEFLRYAPRIPVARYEAYGHANSTTPVENGRLEFDGDATWILNRTMPLAVLKRVATDQSLPPALRDRIALAIWVRAVVLGNNSIAHDIVPLLAEHLPELKPYLDTYRSASNQAGRRFAAAFLLLKFPGLGIQVRPGAGRELPLNRMAHADPENWWCESDLKEESPDWLPSESEPLKILYPDGKPPSLAILSASEEAAAREEWKRLSLMGAAPNYISASVLQWAKKNPNDERVPEALHLAVQAGRWGCGDEHTEQFSRAVFQLLHRRYAGSTWANKTPYWY